MTRKNSLLIFALGITFAIALLSVRTASINKKQSVLAEVAVSANIGGTGPVPYTLFGYTSALATVKLEGVGVAQETQARGDGYYEFVNFFAPRNSTEFCLTPIDTEQRMGAPLCIVAPQGQSGDRFGPYLLSPTISVSNGNPQTGESNQVTGKTIPGTKVTINVFEIPANEVLTMVPPVYAEGLKKISVAATSDGSFTTVLTSNKPEKARVFAQAVFKDQRTPKSNTLTINILSVWFSIISLFWSFLRSLLSLNTFILLQIAVVVWLLYRYFYAHKIHLRRSRALALRNVSLSIEEHHLPMVEEKRTIVNLFEL